MVANSASLSTGFSSISMSVSCENMHRSSFNPRLMVVIGLGTVLSLFILLLLSMRKEPVALKLYDGNTLFVSLKLNLASKRIWASPFI